MPMNGQRRTRLDGVQHSLGTISHRIPQIIIHPEPGEAFACAVKSSNKACVIFILSTLSILPLKTLFLLFVTAVCLTSDTATSSVPKASPAPSLSVCSNWPVSSGPLPRSWAYPSWDLKSETGESYLADGFAPVMP